VKGRFKGFTLIELIIVVAIIGVLSAILMLAMVSFIRSARISKFNANAKNVHTGAAAAFAYSLSDPGEGVFVPGSIYTNNSVLNSTVGIPQGGADGIDIEKYFGHAFEGYFGFKVSDEGSGIVFAVWSDRPVTPDMVVPLSDDDIKDLFKYGIGVPIGCHPKY
jgi:prepilin-type N-terminal cleavage/methylation domain-containing protein